MRENAYDFIAAPRILMDFESKYNRNCFPTEIMLTRVWVLSKSSTTLPPPLKFKPDRALADQPQGENSCCLINALLCNNNFIELQLALGKLGTNTEIWKHEYFAKIVWI